MLMMNMGTVVALWWKWNMLWKSQSMKHLARVPKHVDFIITLGVVIAVLCSKEKINKKSIVSVLMLLFCFCQEVPDGKRVYEVMATTSVTIQIAPIHLTATAMGATIAMATCQGRYKQKEGRNKQKAGSLFFCSWRLEVFCLFCFLLFLFWKWTIKGETCNDPECARLGFLTK